MLDSQGHILLHNEIISLPTLQQRLTLELQGRSDKRLRIRGDRVASLGITVSVLDAARKAGAEGVDIVTQEQ